MLIKIYNFHLFSFQGSPDLKAGREVADYLGTRHHELHFTVQVNFLFYIYKSIEYEDLLVVYIFR